MMVEFKSDRYALDSLLGEGNFGSVYKALDKKTDTYVAIKIEKTQKISQISMEVEVLKQISGENGFPKLIDFGKYEDKPYVVMTLLGQNLQKKFQIIRKIISVERVLDIGIQCFKRIKTLHDYYYIHRDLKPQQFLINEDFNVFLIDFGLCRKYMNSKLMIHVPYSDNRPFVGTANYASLNTHLGIQQSRRDDLESFCYILSYLLYGKLPWIPNDKIKYDEKSIKKIKTTVAPSNLFASSSLVQFFIYVKSLTFEKNPDYQYLFDLISQALFEEKSSSMSIFIIDGSTNSKSSIKKRERKSRKKTINNKFKRSNLCRSLDNINISINNSSQTQVCDHLPEFKDRKIFKSQILRAAESPIVQERLKCCVM
ncbi:hypothetical protein SteCoe_34565 [Stentor coeruleus]|uniref:Casein kinase I n=1 Tax=Stentor coeruleus TaxID=5963 RepID=A0A1R2AUF8_9CILI|nr:hypothetical protein SteCoe_34565 [Stentor coeruleus]